MNIPGISCIWRRGCPSPQVCEEAQRCTELPREAGPPTLREYREAYQWLLDALAPECDEVHFDVHDYGWRLVLGVRWGNYRHMWKLEDTAQTTMGDSLIFSFNRLYPPEKAAGAGLYAILRNRPLNWTKETSMIKPTVGRSLLYLDPEVGTRPMAAQVAYVHSDSMINIGYLTYDGEHRSATSVTLIQDGERKPEHAFACWMPYQNQVAKGEIPAVQHAEPSPAATVPQS